MELDSVSRRDDWVGLHNCWNFPDLESVWGCGVVNDPIRRAERAARLLEHELLREAREHMRDQLTKAMWQRHAYTDAERVKLDAYVRHYAEFFSWLERVITDGRIAEADLQAKSKLRQIAERAKRF